MGNWDELEQKEQTLLAKEDRLNQEIKQVRQVKQMYEEHFNEAGYFMTELQDMYDKNDGNYFYESVRDDFLHESRKIMFDLEQDEEKLTKDKHNVQRQIDDVALDKKKLMATEEAIHEY